MVDIQSATADIRREKTEKKKDRNHRAKIQCPHLLRMAAIRKQKPDDRKCGRSLMKFLGKN